jgi:hypothetical protein
MSGNAEAPRPATSAAAAAARVYMIAQQLNWGFFSSTGLFLFSTARTACGNPGALRRNLGRGYRSDLDAHLIKDLLDAVLRHCRALDVGLGADRLGQPARTAASDTLARAPQRLSHLIASDSVMGTCPLVLSSASVAGSFRKSFFVPTCATALRQPPTAQTAAATWRTSIMGTPGA